MIILKILSLMLKDQFNNNCSKAIMQGESKVMRETVVLGVVSFLQVATFTSFSYIATFMFSHSEDHYPWTGQAMLIASYTAFLTGLSFSGSITDYKQAILIGIFAQSVSYALFIIGLTHLMGLVVAVFVGLLTGYGASMFFSSQGPFMRQLFDKYAVPEQQKGRYIGVLNTVSYLTVLVGAVLMLTINSFSSSVYFAILTVVGILAFIICYFGLQNLSQTTEGQISRQQHSLSDWMTELQSFFKFYPLMLPVILPFMLDGFIYSFCVTEVSSLLPQTYQSSQTHLVFLLMSHGVGAVAGGYLSGVMSDSIPVVWSGVLNFLLVSLTALLSLYRILFEIESMNTSLILGFMWGLVLYFLEGWMFVCCTKAYRGRVESYAVSKQVHTFAFIVFQVYYSLSGSQNIVTVVTLLMLLSLGSALVSFGWLKEKMIDEPKLIYSTIRDNIE